MQDFRKVDITLSVFCKQCNYAQVAMRSTHLLSERVQVQINPDVNFLVCKQCNAPLSIKINSNVRDESAIEERRRQNPPGKPGGFD